jgi:hypothetical protein
MRHLLSSLYRVCSNGAARRTGRPRSNDLAFERGFCRWRYCNRTLYAEFRLHCPDSATLRVETSQRILTIPERRCCACKLIKSSSPWALRARLSGPSLPPPVRYRRRNRRARHGTRTFPRLKDLRALALHKQRLEEFVRQVDGIRGKYSRRSCNCGLKMRNCLRDWSRSESRVWRL